MSYLHCPTCACAYNVAREPACPRCGIRAGTPADPTDDVIHAVEMLARAMARATPIELVAAQAVLDRRDAQLALPAPGKPTGPSPQLLRAVRAALDPIGTIGPAPAQPRWPVIETMFARFSPEHRARWRAALDAALARLTPRLPAKAGVTTRIERGLAGVKTQVKSRVQSFARRLLAA